MPLPCRARSASAHLVVRPIFLETLETRVLLSALLYSVTDLGTLGGSSSEAVGINNSGDIVGNSSIAGDGSHHAFLYHDGSMKDLLGALGGTSSRANGINDLGEIVGSSADVGPYIYDNGTVQRITALDDWSGGNVEAINDKGDITGSVSSVNNFDHAFVDVGGVVSVFVSQVPQDAPSRGHAINESGDAVGFRESPQTGVLGGHAFLFHDGSFQDLGTLGGTRSSARGINNKGQIAGWSAVSGPTPLHAFLYEDGVMHDLGMLNGQETEATAINDNGEIVGFGAAHAFVYSDGAIQDLNSLLDDSGTGWTLQQANAVNDSGQIVGKGINPTGQTHAFLLTPITPCFNDDFNRADSDTVGNGWSNTAGNQTGDLILRDGKVTAPHSDGTAGIYRPLEADGDVTITAKLTEMSAFGGVLRRYAASLGVANDGVLGHGYYLTFYRGDQNYNNSLIRLSDGADEVAEIPCSFQFGPSIDVRATFASDGSVTGTVAQGAEVFQFHFGAHTVSSAGSNLAYWTDFADGRSSVITEPTFDDVTISGSCEQTVTDAPTNVRATDGTFADKVRVVWDPVPSATYDVYRAPDADSAHAVEIAANLSVEQYDDTTAQGSTIYYYFVRAKTTAGESDFSIADRGNRDPDAPTAKLADPTNGGAISRDALNARHYIWITFSDTGGSGLDAASITDPAQEFSLAGAAATSVVVSGAATRISAFTYQYSFTGSFSTGPVTLNFGGATWHDKAGNNATGGAETFSITKTDGTSGSVHGIINGDNGGVAGLKTTIDVSLFRFNGSDGADVNRAIDPSLPTWLIIHGRESGPNSFVRMAKAVEAYSDADQVLMLDWSDGASDNTPHWLGLQGARWIPKVASWAIYALSKLHIPSSHLNIIGHSWGAVMSNEIAADFHDIGQADTHSIVALDPATFGNLFNSHQLDFAAHSDFSWGFWTSELGSDDYTRTADESFDVKLGTATSFTALKDQHTGAVDFFARMEEWNAGGKGSNQLSKLFLLDRLLDGRQIFGSPGGGFDANMQGVRHTDSDPWEPLSLQSGTFAVAAPDDIAGNSISAARKLAVPSVVNGWLGAGNRDDYFELKFKSTSQLAVDLTGLIANGNIELVDQHGDSVAFYSNFTGSDPEHMIATVNAGTYYLHVFAAAASENTYYDLSVAVNASPGSASSPVPSALVFSGVKKHDVFEHSLTDLIG